MKDQPYFNSTLVRLKAYNTLYDNSLQLYFNSTLVRLKEGNLSAPITLTTGFQFHIGAIKSIGPLEPLWDGKDFNSTLVRLKG